MSKGETFAIQFRDKNIYFIYQMTFSCINTQELQSENKL